MVALPPPLRWLVRLELDAAEGPSNSYAEMSRRIVVVGLTSIYYYYFFNRRSALYWLLPVASVGPFASSIFGSFFFLQIG